MSNRSLLIASYVVLHVAPLYAVFAIVVGAMGSDPRLLLAPVFVLFAPAGAYIASYRCRICGRQVFTKETLKAAPGGLRRVPVYLFRHCPACGAEL